MVQQVVAAAETGIPASAFWVGGIGAAMLITFVVVIWGMLRAAK
ncbi:hypothetical protein [Leucobacter sp. M11]|nr:hypothetical protein [Leucobacter sp. M11]MEB4615255.1 hypothetical protein [Leucobacter sp. M11]